MAVQDAALLADRSRRAARSPGRTDSTMEQHVLDLRDRFNWGSRKIYSDLLQQKLAAVDSNRGRHSHPSWTHHA